MIESMGVTFIPGRDVHDTTELANLSCSWRSPKEIVRLFHLMLVLHFRNFKSYANQFS